VVLALGTTSSSGEPRPSDAVKASGLRPRDLARVVALALRRDVVVANLLTFLANGAMFATWLLVPSLLVDERGISVTAGGLILAVSPAMTALAASRAGRVVDRFGPGATSVAGLMAMTAGLGAIAATGLGWPTVAVVVALGLVGLGLGVFSVPNMASVMGALPASDQGVAGAINLMMRTLGIVTGAAWHARVFDRAEAGRTFEAAFGVVFAIAAAVMLVAAAIAFVAFRSADRVSRARRPSAA